MIEDKELGLEIQGKEESKYIKMRDNIVKVIDELRLNLEVNEEVKKFLDRRIEETKI